MATYQQLANIAVKFIPKARLFKLGFNWSPMYKRTTAKIVSVSEDLMQVRIKIPINWKNRNYVGTIFGGSMFSAVDPIPMVQLINLLGDGYVVWDKSATITFKKPARESLFVDFSYTEEELIEIKQRISNEKEIEIIKSNTLTDKRATQVFCEVQKTIYIADKSFYKEKRKRREMTAQKNQSNLR